MAVEFDVKGTRTSEYLGVPLKRALRVLFAECDQQPDVMVFEVHRDTIRALRAAGKGESV